MCAFNNIARRIKSGLRPHLKVRLACAYHPRPTVFCVALVCSLLMWIGKLMSSWLAWPVGMLVNGVLNVMVHKWVGMLVVDDGSTD